MRRSCGFIFSALFLSSMAFAALNDQFTVPQGWVSMPPAESGMISYHTQPDKNQSLLVMVRPITSHGETPMQWADAETDLLRNKGAEILSGPKEAAFGTQKFIALASHSNMGGVDVQLEQYYATGEGPNALIEVAIMGPDNFFKAERSQLDSFLNSFHLEGAN